MLKNKLVVESLNRIAKLITDLQSSNTGSPFISDKLSDLISDAFSVGKIELAPDDYYKLLYKTRSMVDDLLSEDEISEVVSGEIPDDDLFDEGFVEDVDPCQVCVEGDDDF